MLLKHALGKRETVTDKELPFTCKKYMSIFEKFSPDIKRHLVEKISKITSQK